MVASVSCRCSANAWAAVSFAAARGTGANLSLGLVQIVMTLARLVGRVGVWCTRTARNAPVAMITAPATPITMVLRCHARTTVSSQMLGTP